MTRVRVLLADDSEPVREILARIIHDEPSLELVGLAADAGEAIRLAAEARPDVAVVDVRMPGGGGAHATAGIRRLSPQTRVLALSLHDSREVVLEMVGAGASGYLVKDVRAEAFVEAIHQAHEGSSALSPEAARTVIEELTTHLRGAGPRDEGRLSLIREAALDGEMIPMGFQPVVDLRTGRVVGLEALARFPGHPLPGPETWFREAAEMGYLIDLEVRAIESALGSFDRLPAGVDLAVNVSPETILSDPFQQLIEDGVPADRIVVEVTEHARVDDYEDLTRSLKPLRDRGGRVAVDDAGAGFASLRHILQIAPDIIKLDIDLTSGIADDPPRRALGAALVSFAEQIEAEIVAEGIETEEELRALEDLGVPFGQGFYLGTDNPDPRTAAAEARLPHRPSQ